MTTDETNYLIERLKVLCADMTELLNQATEELRRIEQTFDKPSFTATDFGKGTITRYTDEPQTDCSWKKGE